MGFGRVISLKSGRTVPKSKFVAVNASKSFNDAPLHVGMDAHLFGASTVLDLSGSSLKKPTLSSIELDAARLKNDFAQIGGDFRTVILKQRKSLG